MRFPVKIPKTIISFEITDFEPGLSFPTYSSHEGVRRPSCTVCGKTKMLIIHRNVALKTPINHSVIWWVNMCFLLPHSKNVCYPEEYYRIIVFLRRWLSALLLGKCTPFLFFLSWIPNGQPFFLLYWGRYHKIPDKKPANRTTSSIRPMSAISSLKNANITIFP